MKNMELYTYFLIDRSAFFTSSKGDGLSGAIALRTVRGASILLKSKKE